MCPHELLFRYMSTCKFRLKNEAKGCGTWSTGGCEGHR